MAKSLTPTTAVIPDRRSRIWNPEFLLHIEAGFQISLRESGMTAISESGMTAIGESAMTAISESAMTAIGESAMTAMNANNRRHSRSA